MSEREKLEDLRASGLIDEASYRQALKRLEARTGPGDGEEAGPTALDPANYPGSRVEDGVLKFRLHSPRMMDELAPHLQEGEDVLVLAPCYRMLDPKCQDLIVTSRPRILFLHPGPFFSRRSFRTTAPMFDITYAASPETTRVVLDERGHLLLRRTGHPTVDLSTDRYVGDTYNRAIYDAWVTALP